MCFIFSTNWVYFTCLPHIRLYPYLLALLFLSMHIRLLWMNSRYPASNWVSPIYRYFELPISECEPCVEPWSEGRKDTRDLERFELSKRNTLHPLCGVYSYWVSVSSNREIITGEYKLGDGIEPSLLRYPYVSFCSLLRICPSPTFIPLINARYAYICRISWFWVTRLTPHKCEVWLHL
jgi:hypothetical protein